jgi:hypothetical protein
MLISKHSRLYRPEMLSLGGFVLSGRFNAMRSRGRDHDPSERSGLGVIMQPFAADKNQPAPSAARVKQPTLGTFGFQ